MTKVIGSYDDRYASLLAKDQYFRQLHWTTRLTPEEETVLLERVQRGRCADGSCSSDALSARDRLVEGFQGLVLHIAYVMHRRCRVLELIDLVQEGTIGLMQAIAHYDAAAVRSVSAWFGVHIHNAMSLAMIEQDSVVRLTERARTELNLLRRTEGQLYKQLQRIPTIAEVAAALGMSERKVHELRSCRHWKEVESLQGLVEEDEEEDRHDFVGLFEQYVNEANWRNERVREAVASALTKRQEEIIRSRYGMDEQDSRELSQTEIAARYGVAPESIGYSEHAAYRRLYPVLASSCQMAVESQRVSLTCGQCGRVFPQRFAGRRDDLYCSDKCRGAARRVREAQSEEVA